MINLINKNFNRLRVIEFFKKEKSKIFGFVYVNVAHKKLLKKNIWKVIILKVVDAYKKK